MFCPPDHVSFAALWQEFLDRHGTRVCAIARGKYRSNAFSPPDEFGSPLDFCEDVFLETLQRCAVALASVDGKIMTMQPIVGGGLSRMFLKATVFESAVIATDPNEAGPRGQWLVQVGSKRFKPWPHEYGDMKAWRDAYPEIGAPPSGRDPLAEMSYHTLPYCFERDRFVVPSIAPPWSGDVLDDSYVRRVFPTYAGWSFCLPAKDAARWRKDNIGGSKFEDQYLPAASAPKSVGRPGKQAAAREAYFKLYPEGNHASWKEACHNIEVTFGLRVSIRTLIRAVKTTPEG